VIINKGGNMNKKFISLFLVFSLVTLSANLYAKERRGAKLIITKKDGQLIEGELITVKPNSLLLLNTEGKDVSVDIEEIKVIRVVKKSKAMKGSLIGVLIGGGVGALVALLIFPKVDRDETGIGHTFTFIFGGIGVLIGAGIGTLAGRRAGKDKTFRIGEMIDSEIQETMDKLRKKARVRDYR